MAGGTKQKDSFLSMFARENKKDSQKVEEKKAPNVNVNVSASTPPPMQNVPMQQNIDANNQYNQQQSVQPQMQQEPVKEPEEPEEEGQLNIDVYQTEEDIVIKSAISGVKAQDLDINIQNDMVTVRGTRRPDEFIDQEDYYYQECFWGTFSRAVILPVDIDPENVQAELEDGILTVRLPKAEKIKTRKIQVVEK